MGQDGERVADRVRVFSEGIRASEDPANRSHAAPTAARTTAPAARSPRRSTASPRTLPGGLDVFVDRRPDRFGRGGDHEPFLKLGYPAVRFSVGAENWTQQHQDLRTENGVVYGDTIDRMDFAYLAKVTAINVAALARIASAPPPRRQRVTIAGALSRDTT